MDFCVRAGEKQKENPVRANKLVCASLAPTFSSVCMRAAITVLMIFFRMHPCVLCLCVFQGRQMKGEHRAQPGSQMTRC